MTSNSYQTIFSVAVFHTYYEQEICTSLEFSPDRETAILFRSYGFRMRATVNGFDFYAPPGKVLSDLLHYIQTKAGCTAFRFDIRTSNPRFLYFTELPADQLGKFVYDSQAHFPDYTQENILLKPDFIPVPAISVFGNLILHFEDILQFKQQAIIPQFELRFNARSTQWKYFVINKSAIQLDHPAITSKSDIVFDGPQTVTIQNGQQALLFTSGEHRLPLSQLPKYSFDLVNTTALQGTETTGKQSAVNVLFKGLPNPDPGRMELTPGSNQLTSPMYVYV